jgi:hypothetical protein
VAVRISPDQSTSQDAERVSSKDMAGVHARGEMESQDTSSGFTPLNPLEVSEGPRSILIRIIEGEIIPRLFLAHRDHARQRRDNPGADLAALRDNRAFAGLFLRGDSAQIQDRLQLLMDQGTRREEIYLEFLACVPKTLSEFWEDGHCSFEDMAQGLICLDHVLRDMRERDGMDQFSGTIAAHGYAGAPAEDKL